MITYWGDSDEWCSTSGPAPFEIHKRYDYSDVYTRPEKIRCEYCSQKQSADNDCCQFCGAALPDD